MKNTLIFLLLCLFMNKAIAQFGNVWIYGIGNTLDFNQDPPVDWPQKPMNTNESSAVVCDSLGNLLFYSNGISIWDRNDSIMPNGDSLLGGSSASMSPLALPWPGQPKKYILFTVDHEGGPNGLCYSIVDLTLNNGLGEVTLKNQQLHPEVGEKLTGTKHCNGIDYWIVTRTSLTNEYLAYSLTSQGLDTVPVISSAIQARPYAPDRDYSIYGQLKISPNSKLVAESVRRQGLFVYDFNSTNGVVSNLRFCDTSYASAWGNPLGVSNWGVSFSKNNREIIYNMGGYLDTNNILIMSADFFQYSDFETIGSFTRLLLSKPDSISQINGLQLAPDENIYCKAKKFDPNGSTSTGILLKIIPGSNPGLPYSIVETPYLQNVHPNFSNQFGISLPNFYDGIFTNHHKASLRIPYCNPAGTFDSIPFYDSLLTSTRDYHWEFGDPASGVYNESNEQFPIHYFSAPGVYTVTLTLESNCNPIVVTQQVTVTQQTPAQPQITNTMGVLSSTSAFAYQWYFNGIAIPGATFQDYFPTQTGNYYVIITDSSGCTAQSESYGYWVLYTNPKPLNATLFVYPNPAKESVTFELSMASSWFMYDLQGKLCKQGLAQKGKTTLALNGLQKGMYILRAGEKVARVMVE